ncbi:hypothetical protein [Corynebacterium diphtheriae]|uniref:hypothetical protein n=1 Tax=Corynebacterium diphtheriae TaxID=1717 RepID=UPI001FD3AD65|nr:hypothetical protein [Corynebacterium diphtheriae]
MEGVTDEAKRINLVSSAVKLRVQILLLLLLLWGLTATAFAGATTAPEAMATAATDASERLNIGISLESDEVQNVVGQKYSPQVIDSDRPLSKREMAKDNAMFTPSTPRRKHLAHGYDFFVRRWLYTGGFKQLET